MAFGRCTSAFESLGMCRHRLMMAWSRWGMVGLQPMHFSQATPKCFRYLQMASLCSCEWQIFLGIMLSIAMLKSYSMPLCRCDRVRVFQYNISNNNISTYHTIIVWGAATCFHMSDSYGLKYMIHILLLFICTYSLLFRSRQPYAMPCWAVPFAVFAGDLQFQHSGLNALPICPQLCQNMWSVPLESASWARFDRRNLSMYLAHKTKAPLWMTAYHR